MDTIFYLYPARSPVTAEALPEDGTQTLWGKLKKILPSWWKKGESREMMVTVARTEYFFRDYRLVRAAVAGTESMEKEQAERKLLEELHELTEDPDHTYVVCREPLSFYSGRKFGEYLQQEWIEHLLRYGEGKDGYLLWPELILLGRNPYLPYIVCRYACGLRSVKWYLTDREYREDEEWLTEELDEEYGLIPDIRLLTEAADYGKVRPCGRTPCVVLDFCDSEKICGSSLASGSIWLDFVSVEEKERRLAAGCPKLRYFSMKKEWKAPRKALEYLDTISKNGYNNSVD